MGGNNDLDALFFCLILQGFHYPQLTLGMKVGFRLLYKQHLVPDVFLGQEKKLASHEKEVVGPKAELARTGEQKVEFLQQLPQAYVFRGSGAAHFDAALKVAALKRKCVQMVVDLLAGVNNPFLLFE